MKVKFGHQIFLIGALVFIAAGCGRMVKKESPVAEVRLPAANQKPAGSVMVPDRPTTTPISSSNYTTVSGKKPQFVVMAFDGSFSPDMWQKTLDFSKQMTAAGEPLHFTYFLSGVYFLNWRKAERYIAPDGKPGHSLIGFGASNLDIEQRVAYVNRALSEGHEIGSHANGHFDGSGFTKAQWEGEFDSFNNLVFHVGKNNDVTKPDIARYTIQLTPAELTGFRAPDLGKNSAMYDVLKEKGFTYDTSGTGKAESWPVKTKNGIWEFPVAQIKYASTTSNILAMDYNFYFKQSEAKDTAKKGDERWQKFYDDTLSSYINYFNKNYETTRAPVYVGSHFSEWNDGVYWASLRDFAQEICGKPEVYCVSFKELENYLETEKAK